MVMDEYFSEEFKELVAKSRLIALDLGYDYISTVHFFLADCQTGKRSSIFGFAFSDMGAYLRFKEGSKQPVEDWLSKADGSLPLTKEAEIAIFRTNEERMIHQQNLTYPCHFFLAAFDNKESLLSQCFQDTENVKEKLEAYYKELGEFEKDKMTAKEIVANDYFLANLGKTRKKKWYEIWK